MNFSKMTSPRLQAKCHQTSRRYRREVPQKVKNTLRESVRRGRKHCKNHPSLPIWRSAAVPPGTLKGGRLRSKFIEKTIIIAEKSFKNAGGVSLDKFHLNTNGFSRGGPQKIRETKKNKKRKKEKQKTKQRNKRKNTSRDSVGREREHCKLQLIRKIWNSSPD